MNEKEVLDRTAREIGVTEEMVKAGDDALRFDERWDYYDQQARRDVLLRIFTAMSLAAPQ
jgi:hypothetical protein